MSIHSKDTEYNLNKRSIAELDDVIEEIIERNPNWVDAIEKIVEAKRDERTNP